MQAGEKRKRAVEPDGGPDVGVRGNNVPPVLQSAKKAKTDAGDATTS
jgi:lupus La protein